MEHTLRVIDQELRGLRDDLARMGDLVARQIRGAVAAFVDQDAAVGEHCVAADVEVDDLGTRVEGAALRFVALRQPVADDLRRAVAALKIALQLERCGDLAKNIARRTARFEHRPSAGQVEAVRSLGALVTSRLETVLSAYASADAATALAVWRTDVEVDALHQRLFGEVVTAMRANADVVDVGTQLLFIAKNLERIGDHATNIAELIQFELSGAEPGSRPKLQS